MVKAEPNDIIIGRGHTIQSRPANQYYHAIVAAVKPYYDAAAKRRRHDYAELVMNQIQENHNVQQSVRFLKVAESSSGGSKDYSIAERGHVMKKVWQALRDKKVDGKNTSAGLLQVRL